MTEGSRRFAFLGVVALLLASTYVRGGDLDPTARDQVQDLTLAIRIREGGPVSDGNRHPLLPLLLSPIARPDPAFFVDARLVSIVIAGLAMLALYGAARSTYGPWVSLVAGLLFWIELRFQARRICPEPLAALFLVVSVAILARAGRSRRPGRTAFLAGAALGLAWLAKGTVVLSLAAGLLWLGLRLRRRAVRPALGLLAGVLLTGSVLVVHNVSHGLWPLANANSDHVMWEDRWDQDLDETSTATLTSYFATHDAKDALTRLGRGLGDQKAVEWVYLFLGLVLVTSFVRRGTAAGAEPGPRRAWLEIALLSSFVWLPPMAWYAPIARSRRFLFPLVAVLLPPAVDRLGRLVPEGLGRAVRGRDGPRARRAVVAVGTVALALAGLLVVRHGDPWRESHVDPPALALVARLAGPGTRGETILAKPSRTLPPDWLLPGDTRFLALPLAIDDASAWAWVRDRAAYVLLSPGLLAARPDLLSPIATETSDGALAVGTLPSWLALAWREPSGRYVLLRVEPPGG